MIVLRYVLLTISFLSAFACAVLGNVMLAIMFGILALVLLILNLVDTNESVLMKLMTMYEKVEKQNYGLSNAIHIAIDVYRRVEGKQALFMKREEGDSIKEAYEAIANKMTECCEDILKYAEHEQTNRRSSFIDSQVRQLEQVDNLLTELEETMLMLEDGVNSADITSTKDFIAALKNMSAQEDELESMYKE